MTKIVWKPGTMLYPVPAVLITSRHEGVDNVFTVSWVGNVCTEPPMVSLAVRPERHSYGLIKASGEFVINVPGANLAFAVDYCGVKSGREVDKFAALGLRRVPAHQVRAPLIDACPLAIECRVRNLIPLGSHHVFIAEVLAVDVESALIDRSGRLQLEKAALLCYNHGQYCRVSTPLGKFGFSVQKKGRKHKSSPRGLARYRGSRRAGAPADSVTTPPHAAERARFRRRKGHVNAKGSKSLRKDLSKTD